ncbi:MAG: FAD:protein FMN transferase [bacterium]|nr:FAD:protein FMN transferase [bacterium]
MLATLSFIPSCGLFSSSSEQIYHQDRFLMGTLVTISVVSPNKEQAMAAIGRAFEVMQEIENQASKRIPSSLTSRINQAAGRGSIPVSADFFEMIKKSLEYSRLTEGAFDITIGAVTELYHFEDGQGTLPDPSAIRQKLPLVGYQQIQLDEERRTVGLGRPGAMIDLGGIAKGFAVNKAVESLKESGIKAGIVNAGGDIRLFGYKPGHKLWRIGIQHPRKPDQVIASLEITDQSIVTSGDYERFFIRGGVRYHHILDPKTGYPARGCQSVTIVSETATDAMSAGIFVLGPEKGMALIERLPQIEGLIIDREGKAFVSSGLRSRLVWRDSH